MKQPIGEVVEEKGAWLVALEVMPDQVHLLVEVDSQFGVHKLVKAIKGRTSRVLREEFPSLPEPGSPTQAAFRRVAERAGVA